MQLGNILDSFTTVSIFDQLWISILSDFKMCTSIADKLCFSYNLETFLQGKEKKLLIRARQDEILYCDTLVTFSMF